MVSTAAKRSSAHARQVVESWPPENRTSPFSGIVSVASYASELTRHEIGRREARINKMRASALRVSAADQRGADNAHGESDRQADQRVVLDLARDRANGALALGAQFFRHIANALLHALRTVSADLRQIAHGPRCLVDPRTELLDGFGRLSGAQGDPVAAAIRSKDRLPLGFMLLSPHRLSLLQCGTSDANAGRAESLPLQSVRP